MQRSIRASVDDHRGDTRRLRRITRDLRKEHLLACAVHVFAKHGLVASNHDLVAEAANVSVATVFSYYPTRRALIEAVLSEVERFFRAALEAANDRELPAEETLLGIGRAMAERVDASPDYGAILLEWSVATRPERRTRFLALHDFVTRKVADVIERGQREGAFAFEVDPDDEAAILHAAFVAYLQMKATGASAQRLDRIRRSWLEARGWMGPVASRH